MPVTFAADESARGLITAAVFGDYAEASLIVREVVSSPRDAVEAVLECLAVSAAQGVRSAAEIRGMEVGEYVAELFAGWAARAEAVG